HLPGFWEKFYFRPGNMGYPVFDTAVGKVGVYICYDRHFPEGARMLGLHGAELVFIPSATSRALSMHLWFIEQTAPALAHRDRILANAAASTAADVRYAIDEAEKAFPDWRGTPAPQRGDIVRKAADLMERRRDQLARLCTEEEGKVLAESFAEVDRAIANV